MAKRAGGGRQPAKSAGKRAGAKAGSNRRGRRTAAKTSARGGTGRARGASGRTRPATRKRGAKTKRGGKPARKTRSRKTETARQQSRKRPAAGDLDVSLDELSTEEEGPVSDAERARETADAMVGDEEPGGTVSVPDHDQVDQWAEALGVERSPDSPVRGSAELLDERDRRRGGRRPAPTL